MKTNLLPPEIEQVRMIRRKKPWALAASTLLMLGFTFLFLADWGAWAKATSTEFKSAVQQAKTTAGTGTSLKEAFTKAKGEFDTINGKGKTLVDEGTASIDWPALLQAVSKALPDPPKEYKRDADDPKNFDFLSKLAVHIDAIVPRFRSDVDAGWFSDPDAVSEQAKTSMHVYDRNTKPTGEGWIIQVVGHHYNPNWNKTMPPDEKGAMLGPTLYIQRKILPRFWTPELRAFGIHHAALTWMPTPDKSWTTGKTLNQGILAPMLAAQVGPAGGAGGSTGASGGGGSGSAAFAGAGMKGLSMGSGMGMGMGMEGMMGAMGGAMGYGGMMPGGTSTGKEKGPEMKTLTRTDFKIEFIWQPPAADAAPPDLAAIAKQLKDEEAKSKGAVFAPIDETKFTAASIEKSQKAFDKAQAAAGATAPVAPVDPKAAGTPPAAPAPPAAPPAPPGSPK